MPKTVSPSERKEKVAVVVNYFMTHDGDELRKRPIGEVYEDILS